MSDSIGDGHLIELVGLDGGRLEIEIAEYLHPQASDWWDANWLAVTVHAAFGDFRARVTASLRAEELDGLYEPLAHLYDHLEGSVTFETMEQQLWLRLIGDGRGHIAVEGHCADAPATGNSLHFAMQMDQTQLFHAKVQLADVIARFPPRGTRPADGTPSPAVS